jgi:predicted DNA-binding mobile mystery protein A
LALGISYDDLLVHVLAELLNGKFRRIPGTHSLCAKNLYLLIYFVHYIVYLYITFMRHFVYHSIYKQTLSATGLVSIMKMKPLVTRQYQTLVDAAAMSAQGITPPPEGWLRTARKALSMSGAQLARKIGGTRPLVAQAERNELAGTVSLKTLQQMAEAMGCRFVYAIVPTEGTTDDLIANRAKAKARKLVEQAGKHMALEAQSLSQQQMQYEIERLQRQFTTELPSDLWDDK